jgi:lipoprotein signal peptidase
MVTERDPFVSLAHAIDGAKPQCDGPMSRSPTDPPLRHTTDHARGADAARLPRRRRTDHEPRHGWTPALLLLATVTLLDWATKAIIAALMPLGTFVEVWEGRLAFWYVRNDEMVLGLWGNLPIEARQAIALVGASLAAVILFGVVARGHRLLPRHRPWAWAFTGLAFGGMLGNLGERLLFWGVTDFLSIQYRGLWLPPGNVADLAIFLSFPLALGVIVFEFRARALRGQAGAHVRHGTPVEAIPSGTR